VPAVGDINGDGYPDVVVAVWANFIGQIGSPPRNVNIHLYKIYTWVAEWNNGELVSFERSKYGDQNSLGSYSVPILFDLDRDGAYEMFFHGYRKTVMGQRKSRISVTPVQNRIPQIILDSVNCDAGVKVPAIEIQIGVVIV